MRDALGPHGTRLASSLCEMLRITISTVGSRTRIALEGRLVGASLEPLRACWSHESERRDPAAIEIALADVVSIDAEGSQLLRSFHAQGAELLAEDPLVRAILDDLCAKPERKR